MISIKSNIVAAAFEKPNLQLPNIPWLPVLYLSLEARTLVNRPKITNGLRIRQSILPDGCPDGKGTGEL